MSEPESETQSSPTASHLSRRDFAIASVTAGLTAIAGPAYAVAPTGERAVSIKTADGLCDAVLVHPQGGRPAPAVILFPDGGGFRPVVVELAKRLAGEGYAVLAINQFYRDGKAPVFPPGFSYSKPDDRARLMQMIGALDQKAVTSDVKSFIAFLDAQPEVDRKARIGTVGFCMGGRMTIWTAAAVPGRVGAAASFHGGGLVTDAVDSPHKLIPGTNAAFHFGIAADDDEREPQAKTVLKQTLDAARRPAGVEVYPGTRHGWMIPAGEIHNREQAERGWGAMLALYKQALV